MKSKVIKNREKEVTLVTAFFDIGRSEFELFPRSNEKYFEYFKVWGRMKNKLVVYTYKSMAEKVKEYRRECGLLDETIIIEINNEYEIDKDLLEKMKYVSNDKYFLNYRYADDAVENNYKYDYVMLLKYWCLADAVKNKYASGMLAWIDFGFNHLDECYIRPEEFDFTWKVELEDKIHLFALREITQKPIFELVRTFEVDIMGFLIILPAKYCDVFWKIIKHSMESLIDVGFIDDDQLLLLMAYRKNKEIFKIHKSDWFMPLKENGASHLTVREKKIKPKRFFVIKLLSKIKRMILIKNKEIKYAKCTIESLNDNLMQKENRKKSINFGLLIIVLILILTLILVGGGGTFLSSKIIYLIFEYSFIVSLKYIIELLENGVFYEN